MTYLDVVKLDDKIVYNSFPEKVVEFLKTEKENGLTVLNQLYITRGESMKEYTYDDYMLFMGETP